MPRCAACRRRRPAGATCCGTVTASASALIEAAPPSLADFTIGAQIGAGGFASVWSAVRRSDGARVAIKIAHLATTTTARRFAREARALEQLAGQAVPALLGSGEDTNRRPYLALELLVGTTLADELAAFELPPGEPWAASRGAQIATALARLHRRGVVHRDIKPENVFVEATRIVLLDLGLVRIPDVSEALTRAGAAVGTPAYMAPDAELGPAGDVYALGVVLFELITGRLPFEAEGPALELAHRALRPPRPSAFSEVSAELDDLVIACLAKDPARRPTSDELAAQLAQLGERARTAPRVTLAPPRVASPAQGVPPEPLALVQLAYGRRLTELVKLVARHHGVLVERDDHAAVFAFPWLACDHPMRSALAAAASALAAGFAPILHLAPAIAQRNARGQIIVQLVEPGTGSTWRPAQADGTSIMLTATAVRALPTDHAAADAGDGYYRVVEPESIVDIEPTLVGRDELLQAAVTYLRRAVAGEESLLVLSGDAGTGKSRLLREIIDEATRIHPEISVQRLSGTGELAVPTIDSPHLVVLDDGHDASPALLDAIEAVT
ncbi:MAG TPA: serine/threonine-protein kinase, partial [Kofleriaceae bacterium]